MATSNRNRASGENQSRQGGSPGRGANLGGERREGGRGSQGSQQERNESGRFEGKTGTSGQNRSNTGGSSTRGNRSMGEEEE